MARTATFTTELGTKVWEISPSVVKDFSDLSTGYKLQAEDNSAVEGSPLTNERGLEKQSLTFSSSLNAHLGVDVRSEIEAWKEWVGQIGILKIGGETFGPNWLLTEVKTSKLQIDTYGRFRFAKLSFTFEESDEELDDSIVTAAEAENTAVNVGCSTADKARRKTTNTAIQNAMK